MEKETNKWIALNRDEFLATIGSEIYKVCLIDQNSVDVNGVRYSIDLKRISESDYSLTLIDSTFIIGIESANTQSSSKVQTTLSSLLKVNVNGSRFDVTVDDQRSLVVQSWLQRKPHIAKSLSLRAPMPGLIAKVMVKEGETVQKGRVLIILEAMKMENEIRALQSCKIESVCIKPGITVERNTELLRLTET